MNTKNIQKAQSSQAAAKIASGHGELQELDQNIVNNNINNVHENHLLSIGEYLGYTIPAITQTMIEMNGWATEGGDAIKTAQRIAEQIRVPLAFDTAKIYAVVDAFVVVENKELLSDICNDVVKLSKLKYGHRLLDEAVKQLVQEEPGMTCVNPYDVNPNAIPLPAKLPKIIKSIIDCYPPSYHHAALSVIMACLSFHAEGVNVVYNETELYRILWDVVVFADAAGGKSLLDRIKDLFLGEVIERDTQYYAQEEIMKNSTATGKRKRGRKKKSEVAESEVVNDASTEEKPTAKPIQYVGSTTSITELLYRTLNSQGHNLFMYNCEGAEFFLSCRRGPNTDVWTFKRKAVEGSEYVQSHHSVDTVSGICHPHMTSVMCVQPQVALPEFFKHITDGSASRIYLSSIVQTPGSKRPHIKPFPENLMQEAKDTIEYLKNIREDIELKRLHKCIDKWLDERALEYEMTTNLAIDHFRRRAAQMGYKAGVFFYLLDGRKENKAVKDFALYVAEYVFRQQLYHFGQEYNKLNGTNVAGTGINNVNYFNALGDIFTNSELSALRVKRGESANVRTIIYRWRNHKPQPLIEDVEPGVYRKLI